MIDDKILENMNIPLGHKLKILKRIVQIKNLESDDDDVSEKEEFKEKEIINTNTNPNNKFTKRKAEIANKHSIGIGVIPEEEFNNSGDEKKEKNDLLYNVGEKQFDFFGLFGSRSEDENEVIDDDNREKKDFTVDDLQIEIKTESICCWKCFTLGDKCKMTNISEKVYIFILFN